MKIRGDLQCSTVKVAELLAEISAASNERAVGIEQVNKAVGEMDKVTQQAVIPLNEDRSRADF